MRFHELESLTADQLDFVPRERRNQITRLMIAFGVAAVLVIAASYSPLAEILDPYGPILLEILLCLLGIYVITRLQVAHDLLMASEYQSMLLAQGFGVGVGFAMIVRRDGTIVHANDGLETVFPKFNYAQSQALDGMFEQGLVRNSDRERIMNAIYSCSTERVVFTIAEPYQEPKEYVITVEPMARPSGFSIIRGREYHGNRTGLQRMPDALSLTSVDKLDHMLSTTSIPHFTTDAFGRIEFANPAFDRALGYEVGEIISLKLSLHHLVFSMDQRLITEEYTISDFVGEAVLVHKDGSHLKGMLQQSIIRDASEKAIGVTGTLAVYAS